MERDRMSAIYFQMFQKKYNVCIYIYIKRISQNKCNKMSIFKETG